MFLDHIAVLVRSIEDSIQVLKLESLPIGEIESFPSEGTRECYIGAGDAAAKLLLMQATNPEGPYGRALKKRGPGLHHVAFNVPKLDPFVESLAGSGWYLLPQSVRSITSSGTAWIGRPGVGVLLEVQGRERSYDEPVITHIEIPMGDHPELIARLRPSGRALEGLIPSNDSAAWVTIEGIRRKIEDFAK